MNKEYWVYTITGIKVYVYSATGERPFITEANVQELRKEYPTANIEIRDQYGNYLDSVA